MKTTTLIATAFYGDVKSEEEKLDVKSIPNFLVTF